MFFCLLILFVVFNFNVFPFLRSKPQFLFAPVLNIFFVMEGDGDSEKMEIAKEMEIGREMEMGREREMEMAREMEMGRDMYRFGD